MLGAVQVRSPWLAFATHLVVPYTVGGSTGVALVPVSELSVADAGEYLHSLAIRQADLAGGFAPAPEHVLAGPGVAAALDLAISRMLEALAAFCLGAAEKAVEISADYAKQRRQFNRPIGAFQAQQHKLADALLRTRQAKRLVYAAPFRTDAAAQKLASAGAFRLAAKAFSQSGLTGSFVHGGYGLTVEFDIHLYFVYSKMIETIYGRLALERLGEAARAEAAARRP